MVGGGNTMFNKAWPHEIRAFVWQLRNVKQTVTTYIEKTDTLADKVEELEARFTTQTQELVTAKAEKDAYVEMAEGRFQAMVSVVMSMNTLVAEGTYTQDVAIALQEMLHTGTAEVNTYDDVYTNVFEQLLPVEQPPVLRGPLALTTTLPEELDEVETEVDELVSAVRALA